MSSSNKLEKFHKYTVTMTMVKKDSSVFNVNLGQISHKTVAVYINSNFPFRKQQEEIEYLSTLKIV